MKRHAALVPLSRQHHDGLALCVFIERGLRGEAGREVARRLRKQALDLWDLELRGHFAVEEQVLFPGVRDKLPQPETVDRLVREHAQIEEEIDSLRQAGEDDLVRVLRALRERLVAHIRYEERVLFEAVQASVSESRLVDLGRRIDAALPQVCVSLGSAAVVPRSEA